MVTEADMLLSHSSLTGIFERPVDLQISYYGIAAHGLDETLKMKQLVPYEILPKTKNCVN